jgi:hypothetical protein
MEFAFFQVLLNRDLLREIIRNQNGRKIYDLEKGFVFKNVFWNLLEILVNKEFLCLTSNDLHYAMAHGFTVHQVKRLSEMLESKNLSLQYEKNIANTAAKYGYLEFLIYLFEAKKVLGCTHLALDEAAKNGHFEIVKWLHSHRSEGCTSLAMIGAARNGQLEIMQWLHTTRSDCAEIHPIAVLRAAQYGQLEVIKWLHKVGVMFNSNVLGAAVKGGFLEIVQYLHFNKSELETDQTRTEAHKTKFYVQFLQEKSQTLAH